MNQETKKTQLILSRRAWTRLPAWLAEPKLFWCFVLIVFAASLFGDWIGALADDGSRIDRIRYSGWLLDAVGIFGVSVGINRKLNLFHGSTVWHLLRQNFRGWIGRFPLVRHHRIVHAASGHIGTVAASGSLRATVKISPDKPLEDKVAFLLKRNDEITSQLFDVRDACLTSGKTLSGEVKALRSSLSDEISKIEARRAEAHVGEVGWEFVGLAWIFIGITFATVPEFIEFWGAWPIACFERIGASILSLVS